jgi:hypothetical protein
VTQSDTTRTNRSVSTAANANTTTTCSSKERIHDMAKLTADMIETTGNDETVSVIVHSLGGVGKTTFAADAPGNIFLDVENSTREIKGAKKFPVPEIWTWGYILECVDWLHDSQHSFRTLSFDTVDVMEPMAWTELLRTKPTIANGKSVINCKSIEDYPFNGGKSMVLDVWRALLSKLDRLRRDKKMSIIMLSHSAPRMVDNPHGDNYEMADLKVDKHLAGALCDWADSVLYAQKVFAVSKDNKFAKGKAIGDGSRVMHSDGSPAFRAKNRYALPQTMALSWEEFYKHARGEMVADPADIARRIHSVFQNTPLGPSATAGTAKYTGDARKLLKLENWLAVELEKLPKPEPTKEETEL